MPDAHGDRYRLIVDHFPSAYAHHRIIADDRGTPVESVLIDANPVYIDMVGWPTDHAIRRAASDIFRSLADVVVQWYGQRGRALRSHDPLDVREKGDSRRYRVLVFNDRPGHTAFFLLDSTVESGRRTTADKLATLAREHLQDPVGHIDYQLLTDNIWDISGAKYAALRICQFAASSPLESLCSVSRTRNAWCHRSWHIA